MVTPCMFPLSYLIGQEGTILSLLGTHARYGSGNTGLKCSEKEANDLPMHTAAAPLVFGVRHGITRGALLTPMSVVPCRA
eukprot:gene18395-biopygen644